MTLLEIRTKFIELSGRYDLITDTESYQDAGADFFILAGQRWLDRTFEILKSTANYYATLSIGVFYALIPECRVIEEVWTTTADGMSSMLTPIPLKRMQRCYAEQQQGGCPRYYAPCSIRTQPEVPGQSTIRPGTIIMEDNFPYNAIALNVPTDQQLQLQVIGYFYQSLLVNDTDYNFWSTEHPWVLVLAAMRAMEIAQRNRDGVADWETAIRSEMQGLEFDYVDQVAHPITQMEG